MNWHWRDCRALRVQFGIVLWPWVIRVWRDDDVWGGRRGFQIGPVWFALQYDHGNCSAYGLESWFALSEVEVEARAERWEAGD